MNVVLCLNFRGNFLSSYCFRKCDAEYRTVCLLTFAVPFSGITRNTDILKMRNNTKSPLFVLLFYMYTVNSIHRICILADREDECPFLKACLKNFSFLPNKTTSISLMSAVHTSSCASQQEIIRSLTMSQVRPCNRKGNLKGFCLISISFFKRLYIIKQSTDFPCAFKFLHSSGNSSSPSLKS